jgi:hypothetical protein
LSLLDEAAVLTEISRQAYPSRNKKFGDAMKNDLFKIFAVAAISCM